MTGWATPRARGRWLLLGVAAALALLVVVGRLQHGGLATRRPAPVPVPVAPTTTTRPLPVTATVTLGTASGPQLGNWSGPKVGEGRLWVTVDGVLVGVDPRRARVVARLRLAQPGDFVNLVAVGAGAVWVGTRAGVVRVDPATGRVVATLRGDNPPWAAGAGSLWSVDCPNQQGPCRLLRLDPRNLRVIARFQLPGVPGGPLAFGDGSAWLLDRQGAWVWRVDLAGGRVVRVRLPSAAGSTDVLGQLVVGEGAVWTLTRVERPTRLGVRVDLGLLRIDRHTNRVSAITPLADLNSGDYQVELAVGAGGVWVEGRHLQDGQARAVIVRVDPASGRVHGRLETGDPNPAALAAGSGSLWLLRPSGNVLLRLDPAGAARDRGGGPRGTR